MIIIFWLKEYIHLIYIYISDIMISLFMSITLCYFLNVYYMLTLALISCMIIIILSTKKAPDYLVPVGKSL